MRLFFGIVQKCTDDFKPASVDVSKMARMEFSQNNDKVKVTVPNVEASNQPETIFTGNKKPHLKECVLIIDHETGEITLERLTHSINVKKTRVEGSSKSQQQLQRPSTPSSFSPSCSSSGQTSSSGSKPSKPAPNVSPPKDFNGHHHLPVPGHQQLNGKPSSSSSSVAKTVPIPSPLSQPNNAKSAGDGGGGGNNGTSVLSEASSSEDESDSSSSSSGSSSSSDEDDEIRKVEADLCPKINGTSVTASAAAHNNYSGDVMMSSSDEEEEEQMNGLRQYESQMPKEYRSIDTSKAQKLDRNMDTRHLQSSSHFSSSTSGYNRQQVGNKDPLSMPKFSDLSKYL